ncbi:MAG: Gfo/Idh/MocA family oxidoreductase, partial [Pirellulales bacterium]|nr:Gfo/Idh/MocA family oxidoreductase [Pirellulales bacterium]
MTLCVAGVRGQGAQLLATFASLPTAIVKYVCDVDASVLLQRIDETESRTGRRPKAIGDFRGALDDPEVDALVLGTPDHWHAIPIIMACQAGKDVYVEKPDGHNLLEGRSMLAAMRTYGRVEQLGTQGRSGSHLISAMQYLRAGRLGRPVCAKAWESARQGPLTRRPEGDPPAAIDYDMWLRPAPNTTALDCYCLLRKLQRYCGLARAFGRLRHGCGTDSQFGA